MRAWTEKAIDPERPKAPISRPSGDKIDDGRRGATEQECPGISNLSQLRGLSLQFKTSLPLPAGLQQESGASDPHRDESVEPGRAGYFNSPVYPSQRPHLSSIGLSLQRSLAEGGTTTAPAPPVETTQPPASATTAPPEETKTPTPGLIVDDSAVDVLPGQMKKGSFLAQLRSAVCDTAEAALSGTIWSAMGCPWIDHWFGYYSGRDSQSIERAIQKYTGASGVTSAADYIPIICTRVRIAIEAWRITGEIQGVPEGIPTGLPGTASPSAAGGPLSFKAREGSAGKAADPAAIQARLDSGRSLDSGVRSQMESALGQDFSGVRVHTDSKAGDLSDDLHARAFTVGRDIAFASGEYQPGTLIGDALIAHELAHVVQQGGGATTAPMQKGETESNALEEEADTSAAGAMVSLWGGIKGGLANIARNAIPRLRSGLRLQRCKKKAEKPEPEAGPASVETPEEVYKKKLIEGADKLKRVGFGRAEGEGIGGIADPKEKYDKEYWRELVIEGGEPEMTGGAVIIHPDETVLELKSGKNPSDAIDALFSKPEKWQVDCAQFVQAVQWYAMRHAQGAEAFNKSVAGRPFRLRVFYASGIKSGMLYTRYKPEEKMKYGPIGEEKESPKDVDILLAEALVGSRVSWTNLQAPASSDFRNENTIKVGADAFLAHGFGERKIFTRAEIEHELAKRTTNNPTADFIRKNVFIADIESYIAQ